MNKPLRFREQQKRYPKLWIAMSLNLSNVDVDPPSNFMLIIIKLSSHPPKYQKHPRETIFWGSGIHHLTTVFGMYPHMFWWHTLDKIVQLSWKNILASRIALWLLNIAMKNASFIDYS